MTQPQQDPMEVARQIEIEIECYDGLDGGRASREETRKIIAQAILAERQASAAELADLRQVAQWLREENKGLQEYIDSWQGALSRETQHRVDLQEQITKLEEEVSFLTEVRSNQAHLIKCLQSEVANLKGESR